MQRLALAIFSTACSAFALLSSSAAAQTSATAPARQSSPAPEHQARVQALVAFAYENSPISVDEQVVYCPVLGQCPVPGTIAENRQGLKGWEASASHHFSPEFSLVADATGVYGDGTSGFPTEGRTHQYTFLGGPEYSFPHPRFSPFVHGLFGSAHQSVSGSGNSFFITFPHDQWGFAAAAGGGIDARLAERFSLRLLQADYLITHLNGHMQSSPRISAGIILRF